MDIIQAGAIMVNHPDHLRLPHPPELDHGAAFCNGRYSSYDDATVPIWDMGFVHADGSYDVVSVSKGWFFRLEEHLDRFEKSCESFLLKNPYSRQETADILNELVRRAGLRDSYVWFGVTRGAAPSKRNDATPQPHRFYAFATPYSYIADDEARTRGFDLLISQKYIRIPPAAVDPRAKNFHWMDMKLSIYEAVMQGHDWSVLTDQEGFLAEAPGSNIFHIKGNTLYTPEYGCLEGITRTTTLDLAREMGLEVRVEPVHADQLRQADEAFLTSTAGGIMPIRSVDGQTLGAGDNWTKVAALHDLYWTKRWDGWLGTPVNYEKQLEPAE